MTVTEFLKTNVAFLSGLTEDQAHSLASQVEQVHYKNGQTILFKGVTVDGLHVVATGKVGVYVRPPKQKDWTKVAELGPGEVFGETSIVEMTTAGATVKSADDDTLIFVIPQDAFREVLANNSEFQAKVVSLISARKAQAAASAQPPAATG